MKKRLKRDFGASKQASTLLVLFIPSVDRYEQEIDQQPWVEQALEMLGTCFGGATAFPKAKGVWRDDQHSGVLVYDEPVIIQCYTSEEALLEHTQSLRQFLYNLGTQTRQGAVGLVVSGEYLEIQFPIEE